MLAPLRHYLRGRERHHGEVKQGHGARLVVLLNSSIKSYSLRLRLEEKEEGGGGGRGKINDSRGVF